MFHNTILQCAVSGLSATVAVLASGTLSAAQDTLPFTYTVETFQHEDDPDIRAFVVKLEQPFLAEEFEKSNYLRLKAADERAFLIYPRETRFQQKHAEFHGRLRGEGQVVVQLSYETISENPDGSRRVISRNADVTIPIPAKATGSVAVYKTWAEHQNKHFAELLEYYPGESFFEYLLLQSRERYGVSPPSLSQLMPDNDASEEGLYRLFSSGLDLQRSLQRSTLRGSNKQGDLTLHISTIAEPAIKSIDYKQKLKEQLENGIQPKIHAVSHLIPDDQYLMQFNSHQSVADLHHSIQQWAEPVLRLLAEDARDHHLWEKYQQQLIVRFEDLAPLFESGSVKEMSLTGSDFFVAEGTDMTVLLKTNGDNRLTESLNDWSRAAKVDRPDLEDRSFNYRGLQLQARYTTDRKISSFIVLHEDWVIISNSHVGIRRIVDTIQNRIPSLSEAEDYLYLTTLLPPSEKSEDGYAYCSDGFLRYLFSPAFKVGERRRKQSLNNLVMLNNASLFHRLEYGRSPENLTDLIDGRFISSDRIVCPQGGAYAFDLNQDTSTNSVFNRIKYLTPIRELKVLKISADEKSEYERYQKRLSSFWQKYFTPVAARISTQPNTSVEYCLLPFASSADWRFFSDLLREEAQPLQLAGVAESVFASVNLLSGRKRVGELLTTLPGVDGVLSDDPTLTDLNWLGDHMSVHFCDAHTVLEVDPTRLRKLSTPFPVGTLQQAGIATALFAAAAPMYVGIEVEDHEKADRFLEMLSSRIFLHQQDFGEIGTEIDAYQLPAYQDHRIFVLSYRVYAARIRFYVTVVGNQLVAATEQSVLKQVIDAAQAGAPVREVSGQFALRIDTKAMQKLKDDLRIYWEERTRRASHQNVMPIYTLLHLYGVSIDDVDALADAKYGVTYYCPDGTFKYDAQRDQVYSTAYGNREHARQDVPDGDNSTFERAFASLREILFSVNMTEDSVSGKFEVKSR